MISKRFLFPVAVFFGFFALYLFTMHPSLAPYRDAGEMATSAYTLGVSHPTSYPLYILVGRAMETLPLGNPAYRLNLLSALSAAAALAVLFGFARENWGVSAACGAVFLLGFNGVFWSVAVVSEMYSLWVLGALSLLWMSWRLSKAYDERFWFFFCFAFGFFLCDRLDLILWSVGLVWISLGSADDKPMPLWAAWTLVIAPAAMFITEWHWPIAAAAVWTALLKRKASRPFHWAFYSAAFAALGLSLYLYLPIRSAASPWLDWNHPAVWANFVESILRTRYGGTLDLISKNYAKGSLFLDNLRLYAGHLLRDFSPLGILAALWGFWTLTKANPRRSMGLFALYWWSGPFFLLLANMPPNPHAAAIVEPHYLLSDLSLIAWAAAGIFEAAKRLRFLAFALPVLFLLIPFFQGRFKEENRRFHFFDEDYARNVFLSAPPASTIVAKEDVQLFSLWYRQRVEGHRPDLKIVAQGLAGSKWYQDSLRKTRPALFLSPLDTAERWENFLALDRPAFATPDAEIPPEVAAKMAPQGLLRGSPPSDDGRLRNFFALRGDDRYEAQPDFFTSDLIDAYSQADFEEAREDFQKNPNRAAAEFKRAWSLHWTFPGPPAYLAYQAYQKGDFAKALSLYGCAVSLSEELSRLARRYRTLPDAVSNFDKLNAENMIQVGVVEEKLGQPKKAELWYRRSIERFPMAEAHYDLAVLFWDKAPGQSERELTEALRLDPSYAPAAKYLGLLRAKRLK